MSAVGTAAAGSVVMVDVANAGEVVAVDSWARGSGLSVLAVHNDAMEIFLGRLDDVSSIPSDRMPGTRVWFYTNFHCNLACDYCCAMSSPRSDPLMLPAPLVARLVDEAMSLGAREFFLTGGEPFLHPELDRIVESCAAAAPTLLLTNGMLLRGSRLQLLLRLPRENLILQVSLDSPTAQRHDRHRGEGSWAKAVAGIKTARDAGFAVRLAATLGSEASGDDVALAEMCADLGLDPQDTVVRRVAQQGAATDGIVLSRATLVPEICVSGRGVHWHPVAPLDEAMLVTTDISSLAPAVDAVRQEYLGYRRRGDVLAATFPCA